MGRRDGRAGRSGRTGGWARAGGAAIGLALLAGCGPGGPFAPPAKPMVLRPQPQPAPPRPLAPPPRLPQLPATEEAAPAPGWLGAPGEAGPAPAPIPLPVPLPLPDLAGLPAARVEALLGAPASRTASGTGERWRYVGPGCTVDLFLFPAMGGGGLVVLDRRATGAEEGECLRRIRLGGA